MNKEVVLSTRMTNFVSFMYFLLNCITDKRIPYANSLCAQVTDKFCAFHVISIEFYNSANEMQGRVGNITVLFSHCVKKKAALEEVYRIYSINRPGRLLNFWTLRVGAYSRWALIRGWALIKFFYL